MKQILLGALVSLIAICCTAETKQALTLHLVSGAKIVYYLDTEPLIGFNNQDMSVTVGADTKDIPMADVKEWEIGMTEYLGMEPVADNGTTVIGVYGNELTVVSPVSCDVRVYNMSGQLVDSGYGQCTRHTLPKGIYVITVDSNTYKIAIR